MRPKPPPGTCRVTMKIYPFSPQRGPLGPFGVSGGKS